MARAAYLGLLLVAPALTGCFDLGEDDELPPPLSELAVSWVQTVESATVGEPFDLTYRIDGPNRTVPHTGVHYGPESVGDPQGPGDYPESAGVRGTTPIPDQFTVEITPDEAGILYVRAHFIGDAENYWTEEIEIRVQERVALPGVIAVALEASEAEVNETDNVTLNWTITRAPTGSAELLEIFGDQNETVDANSTRLYRTPDPPDTGDTTVMLAMDTWMLAARVIDQSGRETWSSAVEVRVMPNMTPELVEVEATDGVGVPPLQFDPDSVTVFVNDTVLWNNTGSLRHTVTFEDLNGTADNELASLAPGENVTWTFVEPGTYRYRCTQPGHSTGYSTGMVGVVIVEARNNTTGQ